MSYSPIADAFGALEKMFWGLLLACIVFVPLGMWKLVEIIIWISKHVKVSVG